MRKLQYLGWGGIIVLCLIPVALLLNGPASGYDLTYGNLTHIFGQIAALVGLTLFALALLLATRFRGFEDLFGGLDKVYRVHAIIGALSLCMLLLHPILLVIKFIPSDISRAAIYLLPGTYWSVNFGFIALFGLLLLIFITLFTGVRYNYWKISHTFLGIVFIIATFHVLMVSDAARDPGIFPGYFIFASAMAILGISSFLVVLWNKLAPGYQYQIESIKHVGDHIVDIKLRPLGKPMRYHAGQFAMLEFRNAGLPTEYHPFSIASATDAKDIRCVIKDLGDYTAGLTVLQPGDRVAVKGPFGRFPSSNGSSHQIWIAGGIGITPFLGMAEDLLGGKNQRGRIDLYYCVASADQLISLERLRQIERQTPGFHIIPWVSSKQGRLTLNAIKSLDMRDLEVFLCGPESLKNAMRDAFRSAGLSRSHIHAEEFSFR